MVRKICELLIELSKVLVASLPKQLEGDTSVGVSLQPTKKTGGDGRPKEGEAILDVASHCSWSVQLRLIYIDFNTNAIAFFPE